MDGKDAILFKIEQDAKRQEQGILQVANEEVDEIIAIAAAQCRDIVYNTQSEQSKLRAEILSRSETVANLDVKKMIAGQKAKIIDDTFALAYEKLLNLDTQSYKALIFSMLDKAENNDVVTISTREKDILTESELKAFADKKGIKLTLNKQFGSHDGGIILSGGGIDKNLTFEVELKLYREANEPLIAAKLFGENK